MSNIKKHKKGFTLVELLAIIVLLSLISVTGGYFIVNYVNDSKEKTSAISESNILKSAELYAKELYTSNQWINGEDNIYSCVSIDMLINKGYLKKNVLNNDNFNKEDIIKLTKDQTSGKVTNKVLYDLSKEENNFENICSGYEPSTNVKIEITDGLIGKDNWYIEKPTIKIEVDDDKVSSGNYYEYEIKTKNDSKIEIINPVTSKIIDHNDIPEGDITICVKSYNSIGLDLKEECINIKIDTTKPNIPTYVAFHSNDNSTYTSGSFTNKQVNTTISAIDGESGIDKIQYIKTTSNTNVDSNWNTFDFDISALSKNNNIWSGTESWDVLNGRNDSYYFRACDKAGNCSLDYANYTIKYDTSIPSISFAAKNDSGNTITTLTLTASDDYSEVSSIKYCISSTGSICTPSTSLKDSTYSKTFNTSGTYKICAIAYDNASNESSSICSNNYNIYEWKRYNVNSTYVKGSEYGSAVNTSNYAVSTSSTTYTEGNGSCASSNVYYGSRSSTTFGYWQKYTCTPYYSWVFYETKTTQYNRNYTFPVHEYCNCDSSSGEILHNGSGGKPYKILTSIANNSIWVCQTGGKYKSILRSQTKVNSTYNNVTQDGYYCQISSYTKAASGSKFYGTYSAYTNLSACSSSSAIYTRSTVYSWKKYKCDINYSKGSTSYSNVTSTSSSTYPSNGKSGSYWYVKI